MEARIEGRPSFCHIHVSLAPGETIIAESDAMASMAADLDVKAKLNGGLLSGLGKKFLGGESLFINEFTNATSQVKELTLVQGLPGQVNQMELKGGAICLQPGAYVCSTPGLKLGLKYAGLGSSSGAKACSSSWLAGPGPSGMGPTEAFWKKRSTGSTLSTPATW